MIDEPVLEIDEIQGNVLPGFRMPQQGLIAFQVQSQSRLKDFLNYLFPKVTTMREALAYQEERIEKAKATGIFGLESFALPAQQNLFWINLGFGTRLIKLFSPDPENIDPAFKRGLAAGSSTLGDPKNAADEGNKNNWLVGPPGEEVDLFLIAGSDKKEVLADGLAEITAEADRFGMRLIYRENGERLEGDIEHFGFKDGASQPEARGFVDGSRTFLAKREIAAGNDGPDSAEFAGPGKLLLWPGQFIFGYPKQSASHFRKPLEATQAEQSEFLRNGSFLVFRRLRQDVEAFYAETKIMYERLTAEPGFADLNYDDFLAKLVGRYKDGKPVIYDGQAVDESFPSNFNFNADTEKLTLTGGKSVPPVKADPEGRVCPMFAHIRKVNPRDRPTDQGAETNTATFRIMRRGIPFGPPYNFADPADQVNAESRGLFFLSYQTSIKNQFELLVSKWMNKETRGDLGVSGHDLLVGQNNEEGSGGIRRCLFAGAAGQPAVSLETAKSFVIPTGGGYFFCPSKKTLGRIIEAAV